MPKRINPQDQWETDFLVPLPGEPRNIGPLETLFQRLLNRTERLKNRIAAILGMSWDATPPDTLAGLAGRVSTLETNQGGTTLSAHRAAATLDHPDGCVTSAKLSNEAVTTPKIANGAVTIPKLASTAVSTGPTPNTLPLRNAQGALQDGASDSGLNVLRVGGIYTWRSPNKWLRLASWTGFSGSWRGLFADLTITRLANETLKARLRASLSTDESGSLTAPLMSLAADYYLIVGNAVLVQTAANEIELWAFFPWSDVYVDGVIGASSGTPVLTPYGDVASIVQNTPPTAIPGGLYLEWVTARVEQTPFGPGHIVAASRNPSSGYVRYDNGIQVCWGIVQVSDGTWTFPAAFASLPQVLATPMLGEPQPRVATLYDVSMTQVRILRTDLAGNTVPGPVYLYAVGLWK